MKHEITIPLGYLRAAFLFAAKKDVRTYLIGVAIHRGLVTATDGKIGCGIEIDQGAFPDDSIIPRGALDFFLKKTKAHGPEAEVTIIRDEEVGTIHLPGAIEHFQFLDGRFPDIRRILPTHREPLSFPQLVWSQLVTFERAAVALGVPQKEEMKILVIPGEPHDGVRVVVNKFREFNGVVMPLRETYYADALASVK